MKKKTTILMIAFLFLAIGFGPAAFGSRAEAAALKNVLKAPKAKAGSWQVGNRYRYKSNGQYAKNVWLNIDGYIYYFKKDGYPSKGWVTYGKKKYYFDKEGALVTGWLKKSGARYYLSKTNGALKLGKKKIGSKYYYFHPTSGKMLTGWQKIGGDYYYFNKSTGAMAVNKKVGNYYVDRNGKRTSGGSGQTDSPAAEKTGTVDIFVGDSRTVGMCSANHGSGCSKCIAEVNMGYDWLVSTAIPKLKTMLKKDPDATVVFNLGINDVANYAKYISKYRTLVKKYPQAKFYFMSVNPVGTKYKNYDWFLSYSTMRSWILKFNTQLQKAFPDNYIDCYSYLMKNGFSTKDGVHYTTATYRKIYNYIIKQV